MAHSSAVDGRWLRAECAAERLFDMSLDLLCVAGLDGYFKRVNPAFERALGYSRETLLSRPFLEFVHPDDRGRTLRRVEALRGGAEVVQFSNRYMRSDGSVCWLEWRTRSVRENGLMYAAGRDVTASRCAAAEQAALRRVAMLVARGVAPADLFNAVVSETRRVLDVDAGALLRFEPDGGATMMATDTTLPSPVAVGDRLPPDDDALFTRVRRTGRPARLESYEGTTGWLTRQLDALGYRGSVGVPISVDGRLWGAMAVLWANAAPPPGSEHRLLQFTELVATAVANAESRAELMASRARVVDASDEARRRIQRDLHDGVQQRLVALGLQARAADPAATIDQLREQLSQLSEGLTDAIDDLREVSLGIHPAILKHGGLPHAIHALARRSTVPVQVAVPDGLSLLERVEVAAYYVVAEALTNAAKHARASVVEITARTRGGSLELTIRDDGVGGATGGRGTGLVGLTDRVEALGGKIRITSPPGAGTTLRITLPLKPAADALSFDRL